MDINDMAMVIIPFQNRVDIGGSYYIKLCILHG